MQLKLSKKLNRKIVIKSITPKELLFYLFLVFCFLPFLFPNPIAKTNIQPYAALLGTLILLIRGKTVWRTSQGRTIAAILGCTFLISLIVAFVGGISVEAIRGVYNYYALFVVPCAVIVTLEGLAEFPEKLFKIMILIWFFVATIQFFVYRGFATQLISGVRWSSQYRGVVGLASEPSFLGISCFYFLHIIRKFKTRRVFYSGIVLLMGVLYAQSTTGILFIIGFYVVFLLDMINSRKGVLIWGVSVVALAGFAGYLRTRLVNSRLNQMIDAFLEGGVDSVLSDGSASVRFNAIGRALGNAAENLFFPSGFGARIGSAYGGFLVELGFFAIPAILVISYGLALTFKKNRSRILYFIVVSVLFLNNTQLGNPLLLLVIGINIFDALREKRKTPEAKEDHVKAN